MNDEKFAEYLTKTPTIESEHPDVRSFAKKHCTGAKDQVESSVRLYYAVRDSVRYDPYHIVLSVDGLKATTTMIEKRGWCVSKAILLAACCRAQGIPSRLGFADVRNHLSTARLRQRMKTDIFFWHGYTSIYLNGRWVKATPAFNIELCHKFRLLPLEFDGVNDSIYHPFDLDGNRHMEYVNFRGEYPDVPIDAIAKTFRKHYPSVDHVEDGADFDRDVERETTA